MKSSHKRIFAVLAILMVGTFKLYAALESGLRFLSYDVTPEKRTALSFEGRVGKGYVFADSLELNFSIKPDIGIGRFGYICRTKLSAAESVDILIYTPWDRNTSICATGDHENLLFLPLQDGQWQDLSLRLVRTPQGGVEAFLNGESFALLPSAGHKDAASFFFGANTCKDLVTSDVAPMSLRDVTIVCDGNVVEKCDLSSAPKGCGLSNPLWLEDMNSCWHKVCELRMPSPSYICPANDGSVVYVVSEGQVMKYDTFSKSYSVNVTCARMNIRYLTNDFVVLNDGTLAYLDIDFPSLILFDENIHDWQRDNQRIRSSVYLHSNTLYDEASGCYALMFGYGYHRYSSRIRMWNPESGKLQTVSEDAVPPRYLAAAGIDDGKIYIYSGKGNSQGAQELGSKIYGDLWSVDLRDFSAQKLWDNPFAEQEELAAADLIFEDGGDTFLALSYNPNIYSTGLQLKRYSISGQSFETLADVIPYNFVDTSSEARLVRNERRECYYAFVSQKREDGEQSLSVYELNYPIVKRVEQESAEADGEVHPVMVVSLLSLFLTVAILAVIVLGYRRRRRTIKALAPTSKRTAPGIYLLGDFTALAQSGEDITAQFSPLMRQLLIMICVGSLRDKGVSNAELKDTLWYDKSDESYNNNRGVTLKKIRDLLQKVNPGITIASNNGYWRMECPEGSCDFFDAVRVMRSNPDVPAAIAVANLGPLLPREKFDWLDNRKSVYDNFITSLLESLRTENDVTLRPEKAIAISDAILRFDSLDEAAILIKCQALIRQRKTGTAKRVFDSFVEEYRRTMAEDFEYNFTDFVKKSSH